MSDLTPPWQLPDNHKFNKVLDLVLTREAKYLDIIEKQNKEIKELRGILTGGIECGYVKPERRP